jgi:hypothetical protein
MHKTSSTVRDTRLHPALGHLQRHGACIGHQLRCLRRCAGAAFVDGGGDLPSCRAASKQAPRARQRDACAQQLDGLCERHFHGARRLAAVTWQLREEKC